MPLNPEDLGKQPMFVEGDNPAPGRTSGGFLDNPVADYSHHKGAAPKVPELTPEELADAVQTPVDHAPIDEEEVHIHGHVISGPNIEPAYTSQPTTITMNFDPRPGHGGTKESLHAQKEKAKQLHAATGMQPGVIYQEHINNGLDHVPVFESGGLRILCMATQEEIKKAQASEWLLRFDDNFNMVLTVLGITDVTLVPIPADDAEQPRSTLEWAKIVSKQFRDKAELYKKIGELEVQLMEKDFRLATTGRPNQGLANKLADAEKALATLQAEHEEALNDNLKALQIQEKYRKSAEKFRDDVDAAQQDIDKLQKFKDYVHSRLTEAGVPTHPNGQHSQEGCRIGDRLDWLFRVRQNHYNENVKLKKELHAAFCKEARENSFDSDVKPQQSRTLKEFAYHGRITDAEMAVIDRSLAGEFGPSNRIVACELLKLTALIVSKNRDYGSTVFRPTTVFGRQISPGDSILVRLSDKFARLDKLFTGAEALVASEGVPDTLKDAAAYMMLLNMLLTNGQAIEAALNQEAKAKDGGMPRSSSPMEGACWYCREPHSTTMLFSGEFDCYVHEDCLRDHAADASDEEAQIMARELIPGWESHPTTED